jgi:thiol-disulfide isomerase/thioredoxin
MKIQELTCFLIAFSFCVCAISISCAANKSFDQSTEKIGKKLLEYHSEDYPAKITNVMWRKPDIELTVTIEIEPDAQSGKAFEDVLEQTRWASVKACNAMNFPHHAVPPINILVRDDGQLVHVERGGFAHFVAIALNLPTGVPAFVNFSADWCDKGHETDAAMDEVAKSIGDKVHFETVDTDKEVGLTSMANVVEVPSQMVFDKSGSFVGLYDGPMEKDRIAEILQLLVNDAD